jgi:RNA polymerase-binding protein DksA
MSAVADTARFKEALLAERERVVHAIGSIETEEMPLSGDDEIADSAAVTLDREIDSALEENSEHVLAEIDAALERIEAGTYGTCEDCGRPIGEERLEALPWARLCIDDARKRAR